MLHRDQIQLGGKQAVTLYSSWIAEISGLSSILPTSERKSFQSVLLAVMKLGSNCCKLPIKPTEEEIEEAAVSLAFAKEIGMDAVLVQFY